MWFLGSYTCACKLKKNNFLVIFLLNTSMMCLQAHFKQACILTIIKSISK